MAENQEGKSRGEEEYDALSSEREGLGEAPQETPEARREREYLENKARLEDRARQYLAEERSRLYHLEESSASSAAPAPLPTMADARAAWQKSRSGLNSVTEALPRLRLRIAGVEDPADVLALTRHLEQTLMQEERHYVHVKASQKDREIQKYRRQGYEIHDVHDSYGYKGEVEFTIERELPYRASPADRKKFAELLGQANDPVAMIERLRRFGFSISAHTITHQFEALKDFVASAEINDLFERFERAGLTTGPLYFGYMRREGERERYEADLLKEYASAPRAREELNDENLQRISRLKQLGFEIRFDAQWDETMRMIADDSTYALLMFIHGAAESPGPPKSSGIRR